MANKFLLLLFLGVLGAVLGSFVASFASRICEKKPIFAMRSFCFSCKKKLGVLELVPIFSYLFLRSRCKTCGKKIPLSSFLSEIFGIFLTLIAFFYAQNLKELLCLIVFFFTALALSLIDLKLKAVPSFLLWVGFFCAFLIRVDLNSLVKVDFFIFIDSAMEFFSRVFVFAGFVFLLKSFVLFVKNFKKQEVEENLGDADIIFLATICGIFGFLDTFVIFFLAALLSLPFFYLSMKKGEKELAFLPFISFSMFIMCVNLSFGSYL